MNMQNSAKDIYQALKAAEADYAALGLLDGMSETAEYIALGKSVADLHKALNEARKGFFPDWREFMQYIGQGSTIQAFVGGSGGKDNDPPGGGD